MSRLLFLIVIFVVIYLLLRSYSKQLRGKNKPEQEQPAQAEDMVRCGYCGVHLPKRESTMAGDLHFCSEAHRCAYTDQQK